MTKRIARVAKRVMLRQVETKSHLSVSGVVGLTSVIMPDNVSRVLISNVLNLDHTSRYELMHIQNPSSSREGGSQGPRPTVSQCVGKPRVCQGTPHV